MASAVKQLLLQCFLHLTLGSLLFPIATVNTSAFLTSLPGCPDKCGNITIPYPFGTQPGCYRDGFAITCNESFVLPKPFFGDTNIDLSDIDINTSEVIVPAYIGYDCYNETGNHHNNPSIGITSLMPFLFSYKRNKFTVIGCHALAYIAGGDENSTSYTSGCASFCDSLEHTTGDGGACDGLGCCQTAVPEGLSYYEVQWGFKDSTVWSFNPCSYVMLMQEGWYNFSVNDLVGYRSFYDDKIENSVPVVLDWAIRENGICLSSYVESSISPACQSKLSRCDNTTNGNGYICKCFQGYEGNPYIPNGCTDIDECKLPGDYPCFGTCRNIEGSYECVCPSGTTGNGKVGECIEVPLISPVLARVFVGLGCGLATMLGMCFFVWAFRRCRRHVKEKELYEKYYKMMDNQLRVFSKKQIEMATNNFDESYILGSGGRGKVYKGVFGDNHVVAIKMSREVEENHREEFLNEIVLLSQINHKNIVRVLGCCLKVKIPMLVYEFVPNGTRFELLHVQSRSRSVPLAARLKIALESAEALDYLHSSISRPIIHGDVKSANILLDEGYCAKVSDFGGSNTVPIDNTQVVELFQWTVGYLDPECLCSQTVTKSSDVYSFGVVMLELITRRKAIYRDETDQRKHLASEFVSTASNSEVHEMLDAEIVTDDDKVIEVLKEMSELAIWCVSAKGEDRPTMKQVAEKLQFLVRIYGISLFLEIDPVESQSLLGEQTFYTASDTTTFPSSTGLCSTVLEIDTGSTR